MTHALCFALAEVLVNRTRSDAAILCDTLSAHDIDPSERLLTAATDAFRDAFAALKPAPYRQSMAAVVAAAESDADPDDMVETLREQTHAATEVPDAARESLVGLAGDNRLAVVTDGPREWQVGKLDHHDLLEQFDTVVASYDVGTHKPDAAPFERVRAQVDAEEYVMVGDESDVEGARAAGFVTIEYDGPALWATIGALL